MTFIEVKKAKGEYQQYTLGIVYPANQVDAHGDTMTEAELEKAAWHFMSKTAMTGRVGVMHKEGTGGAARVVESYIYRGPKWKLTDASGEEQVVMPGDWLMGVVWNDEVWKDIESGELKGFSLQGMANLSAPKERPMKTKRLKADFADVVLGPAVRTFTHQEIEQECEEHYARIYVDDPASAAADTEMADSLAAMAGSTASWSQNVREFIEGPNSDFRAPQPADRRRGRGVAKSVSDATIRQAFMALPQAQSAGCYVREVLVDPMAVIVEEKGQCFMVPYAVDKSGAITFDLTDPKRVQQDWGVVKRAGCSFQNVIFG